MQVSWIDADNLKDLLARIAPGEPPAAAPLAPRSWDSMPSLEPDTAASFIITAEEPFVPAKPQEGLPQPAQADLEIPPPAAHKDAAAPPAPVAPESLPVVPAEAPAREDHADHAAAALPLSRIRDKLRAIRQRANEAGMLAKGGDSPPPAAQAKPAPPSEDAALPRESSPASAALSLPRFEAPSGSRQERLAAFAGWARQILHEDGGHLLVMNDDGELLWGGEAKAGLVLSAMMAWGATLRSSATTAFGSLPVLHQSLASGHMLTAIPCETVTGLLLHAAVVGPAPIPDEIAMQLRQGLIRAAGTQFA